MRLFAVATAVLTLYAQSAWAVCDGASSDAALDGFNKDPVAWADKAPKDAEVGPLVVALAASAVNRNDTAFGKNLGTMLGRASSDQGRIIGAALSGLEGRCTDAKDPSDIADKKYISLNILPNLLSNVSANLAFGEGSGPETTSTGGGGGGGTGTGPINSELPTGGSNNGAFGSDTNAFATDVDGVNPVNAGSIGASASDDAAFQTLTTNNLPATVSATPGGTGSGNVSTN